MNKITELHNYLENCAEVKKLKEDVEKLESHLESLDKIVDIDDDTDDLSATLYNKIHLKTILLKTRINEIEKEILLFELMSATED